MSGTLLSVGKQGGNKYGLGTETAGVCVCGVGRECGKKREGLCPLSVLSLRPPAITGPLINRCYTPPSTTPAISPTAAIVRAIIYGRAEGAEEGREGRRFCCLWGLLTRVTRPPQPPDACGDDDGNGG